MSTELFGLILVAAGLCLALAARVEEPPTPGRPAGAWQTARDDAHRWSDDHTTRPIVRHTVGFDNTTNTTRGTTWES